MFRLLEYKRVKQRLLKNFEKNQARINQPIDVRDILVYSGTEDSLQSDTNQDQPVIPRIIQHIEQLSLWATSYHKKYYCIKTRKGKR